MLLARGQGEAVVPPRGASASSGEPPAALLPLWGTACRRGLPPASAQSGGVPPSQRSGGWRCAPRWVACVPHLSVPCSESPVVHKGLFPVVPRGKRVILCLGAKWPLLPWCLALVIHLSSSGHPRINKQLLFPLHGQGARRWKRHFNIIKLTC